MGDEHKTTTDCPEWPRCGCGGQPRKRASAPRATTQPSHHKLRAIAESHMTAAAGALHSGEYEEALAWISRAGLAVAELGESLMSDQPTCATEGHLWGPLGTCVMCGHPAPPPGVRLVSGIGRGSGIENAVVIYCSRQPTDDEMRAIHEAAREACGG